MESEVELYKLLLCPKGADDRFHRPACIHATCKACKDRTKTLMEHFSHLPPSQEVSWTRWTQGEKWGRQTRLPIEKTATVKVCLEELVKDVLHPLKNVSFSQHLFTAHWEAAQYRQLKETLKPTEILLVQDFAENRKAACQDEIKQAHFGKKQITLHPVIAFYLNENGERVRHAINFISDDTTHDHHAVHQFTAKTFDILKEQGVLKPESKMYIFSDGCAAQYKGRGTFADLSLYTQNVHRVYFGSEHGKGEADGETGVISKSVKSEILCRKSTVTDAASFMKVCDKLQKDEPLSKRAFVLVEPH